jgi:hypothetical protein
MAYQTFKTPDGIEVIIDTETHLSYMSLRGYSRVSGVAESTVRYRFGIAQISTPENAEIQTQQGLRIAQLLSEEIIADWIVKDNPKVATKMLKAGIRVYLHHLAGYELHATVKPDTTELDKQIELAREQAAMVREQAAMLDKQAAMLDKQAAIARLDYAKHLESIERECRQRGDLQAADFTKATIMRLQTVVVPSQSGGDTGSPALPSRLSEGAVDVAIRLGYSVPPKLEGALGKYVKDKCGHLILGFKDIRYAPVSGKNVPANQYPRQHHEVEQAVKDYLTRKNLIN